MSPPVDESQPGVAVRYTPPLLGAAAALGGLLHYLRWARTHPLYRPFGLRRHLAAHTPQDRFLRGMGLGFRPISALLLGVAAALVIHVVLRRFHNRVALAGVMLTGFLLAVPALCAVIGWLPLTHRPLDVGAALVL